MSEFTPVLIVDNPHVRQTETNRFQGIIPELQNIVDSFNDMKINKDGSPIAVHPLESTELESLVNNHISLVVSKMTEGAGLEIGGLSISNEKAFELLEKPIGYVTFLSQLEAFKGKLFSPTGIHYGAVSLSSLPKFYLISNDNQVEFSPILTANIEKMGKIFATSQVLLNRYNFIKSVFDSFISTGAVLSPGVYLHTGGSAIETFIYMFKEFIASADLRTGKFQLSSKMFNNS